VCCEASCERDCERCDAPAALGRCVLDAEDQSCSVARPGFQCVARGRCRLPAGQSCGVDADCDSEHCEPAAKGQLCCERSCHGTCELCGATGACDAFPARDDACPGVSCPAASVCRSYRTPEPRECRRNAECAACEPSDTPAGVPCAAGAVCDGKGACRTTNLGVVAAGGHHTCAVSANGNVRCFGRNVEGELGTAFTLSHVGDDEAPADVELELDFAEDVVAISAGYAHTCVLFLSGGVRCWGVGDPAVFDVATATLLGVEPSAVHTNSFGFVEPLTAENVRLPGPAIAISAAAAGGHSCALLASGDVACWGYNGDGACGYGDTAEHELATGQTLPVLDLGGARAVEVRAADDHTCVLLEGGGVACWGEGNHGRLGYGDDTDRYAPEGTVALGEPVLSLAVGSTFTCVLLAEGRVRCFGYDDDGQLGYGHDLDIGDDETPAAAASLPGPGARTLLGGDVPVGGGTGVVQLVPVAGSHAVCARFASGSVRCWGENDHGELGYGHTQTLGTIYTPDELAARYQGGDVELGGSALALAENGRCALVQTTAAPALYCWGDDRDGQLGIPQYFPDGSKRLVPLELGPVALEP
jgi:alpha-tubulin suppressor-like RCC1 family protein